MQDLAGFVSIIDMEIYARIGMTCRFCGEFL